MSTKIEVVKLGTSIHLLFKHVSGFTGSTTTDSVVLSLSEAEELENKLEAVFEDRKGRY